MTTKTDRAREVARGLKGASIAEMKHVERILRILECYAVGEFDQDQLGGFLNAVINNDLRGAVIRADPVNRRYLKEIAMFAKWDIPQERIRRERND